MARRKRAQSKGTTTRTAQWESRPVIWNITLKDGSRRTCAVPFGALTKLMDYELATQIQCSRLDSIQQIVDCYMELHRNKYGKEFLVTAADESQNIVLCKTTTQDGCTVARPVPTEVALSLMDLELLRQVDDEMMPCMPQAFMDRYMELHREKYGVEFLAQQFAEVWGDAP